MSLDRRASHSVGIELGSVGVVGGGRSRRVAAFAVGGRRARLLDDFIQAVLRSSRTVAGGSTNRPRPRRRGHSSTDRQMPRRMARRRRHHRVAARLGVSRGCERRGGRIVVVSHAATLAISRSRRPGSDKHPGSRSGRGGSIAAVVDRSLNAESRVRRVRERGDGRARRGRRAGARTGLRRRGSLPLRGRRWPLEIQTLLLDLGVRTIAGCLRLPRDGFARRVGLEYLHDLDRALARRFDPRVGFVPARRWDAKRELYQESSDAAVFMAAVEDLLDDLTAELRRRQAQVRSLRIEFQHVRGAPTRDTLDRAEPTHERGRLLGLLRDRLERIVLPAPAVALRVTTGFLLALQARPVDLFDKTPVETLSLVLLERLRGCLGSDAVHGIASVAEHRPEFAWSSSAALLRDGAARADGALSPWARHRPLWLLPGPLPLSSRS